MHGRALRRHEAGGCARGVRRSHGEVVLLHVQSLALLGCRRCPNDCRTFWLLVPALLLCSSLPQMRPVAVAPRQCTWRRCSPPTPALLSCLAW